MAFRIVEEYLHGIKVVEPSVFGDERGYFKETFHTQSFADLGLPTEFHQDNHSRSSYGVVRGLHFQWDKPMGKLLRVVYGEIMLVEVDIRPDSPTCGEHIAILVSATNHRMVWIPPGFANGFVVISESADVLYKCTAVFNNKAESGIRWNDSTIGIPWNKWLGETQPIVSEKDQNAQSLTQWLATDEARIFSYT